MENKKVECWETLCLKNSHCDTFEDNSNKNPYCLDCQEDCPNRIETIF